MLRKKNIVQATLWSLSGEQSQPKKEPASRKRLEKKSKVAPTLSVRDDAPVDGQREKESGASIFSVGDYLSHLSRLVGAEEVLVQGEISGYKTHPAGAFFSLKDQEGDGLLRCYMPPRYLHQLGFDLEDGLLVQATGVASIYRPRGELSFTVSNISLVGDGSLRQAYEALKKKLEEEGLFARKRELPEFIQRIGLVTAKTGEVIHDFRRNLKMRGFEIDFIDVRVQGSEAPTQIVEAIQTLNKKREVEIIVVMRGGGSLEDLQAFNDERVARAIFRSDIPIVAAIGHARDIPIAYLVADATADTPTAAAVTMNRSWDHLEDALPLLRSDLLGNFSILLEEKKNEARASLQRLLFGINRLLQIPKEFRRRLIREIQAIEKRRLEIGDMARRELARIVQSLGLYMRQVREGVSSASIYLQGVSPERNLRLGYSIVTSVNGRVVKQTKDLVVGDSLKTLLADGSFISKVETIDNTKDNHA